MPRARTMSRRAIAELVHVRQGFLDALPIATAVVRLNGARTEISAANVLFDALRLSSPALFGGDDPISDGLSTRIAGFFDSDVAVLAFEWSEGGRVDGRHFQVRLTRLEKVDDSPRALIALIDRTAEVQTQRSLRAEMLHDSLTGLPNRAAFNEAVEEAITRDGDIAVLVIDLNRFSRINECMGSLVGDELIITVARRLLGAIRGGDLLARLGGDEFGVLLHLKRGPDDALHAARRIETTLATPFRLSDLEIRVDCAIGCARTSERVNGSDDLVRNAQFALKRAKQSGRLEVYRPGEVNAVRRRFSIETELRRAIEGEQLTLAYQPLIDLQSGGLIGFEALARWEHPDEGPIGPHEFIPVAEESGLIVPLGRWAMTEATRTLAGWDARAGRALPLSVSVNVSAIQIARDDVAGLIADALAASGLSGGRLTIELTESAIINDPERAGRALRQIKALDLKVAMDDFGTGYSNLAYLQKLPIDILKIDRSFVTPMLRDRDSVAIVRAVLSLADALGMATTAEGVETVELAQTLAALGCSVGQGYHFARPLAADAAYAYWRSSAA